MNGAMGASFLKSCHLPSLRLDLPYHHWLPLCTHLGCQCYKSNLKREINNRGLDTILLVLNTENVNYFNLTSIFPDRP